MIDAQMKLHSCHGTRLRDTLRHALITQTLQPWIGIYDVFSATLAANHFETVFVSGFGLAASSFGLPDVGFIGLSDLITVTTRLRTLFPDQHIIVDVDDGFGDARVASHVTRTLERCGASGVVLEDQARPRRCGHLDGKQLLPLEHYLEKLDAVLRSRSSLFVVARTDASEPQMILERVKAFEAIGCDAVLADGVKDLDLIRDLRSHVSCPIVCNVIGGGKVPACSRADLARAGVQALIYSTSCLFAAQAAMERTLASLQDDSVVLANALAGTHQLFECNSILHSNFQREANG